jgi:hypothetical protein
MTTILLAMHVYCSYTTAATLNDPDALVVKFQTIVRDGKEIVVGRLKVATVSRVILWNPLRARWLMMR